MLIYRYITPDEAVGVLEFAVTTSGDETLVIPSPPLGFVRRRIRLDKQTIERVLIDSFACTPRPRSIVDIVFRVTPFEVGQYIISLTLILMIDLR